MPGSLEEQISSLRTRAKDAQIAAGRAQQQREQAQAKLDEVKEALRTEFGVQPGEAQAELERLRAELAQEASRVRAALEEAQS